MITKTVTKQLVVGTRYPVNVKFTIVRQDNEATINMAIDYFGEVHNIELNEEQISSISKFFNDEDY